jgi:hypothetical protein
MKRNYRSERHRKKVMRKMRLAGYDLPGTPYKHVNRSYTKRTSSSMRTSPKVKTTKVITGAMTVRGKPVSEAQRKAIWAKYGKHIWEMEDKTINDEVNKSKQEFPNDRFLRQTKNPVVRRPGATM